MKTKKVIKKVVKKTAVTKKTITVDKSKKSDSEKKYIKALDSIRPALQSHGGDAEFVSFKNGVYSLRLKGVCLHCHFSMQTFENYISTTIKENLPEVKQVKLVE